MKRNTRSFEEIERDIVKERAEMNTTLNNLKDKFSVDAILDDVGHMFRGQGGEIGRAISQTAGRNPAAVAIVGVGLAWLFLGHDRRTAPRDHDRQSRQTLSGRRNLPSGWEAESHMSDDMDHPDDWGWYGDDKTMHGRSLQGRGNYSGSRNRSGHGGGMMGAVKSATSAAGDMASDAADSVRDTTSNLTERLSHGLEDFSEDAKARIMTARRAAHDARVASEATLHKGSRAASDFFVEQPLVVGALAVAVGAALGSMLPHSRMEDDTFGESSDQLFANAQAVYREERDKAMAELKSAASDVKSEVREMGSELVDSLPDGKVVGRTVADHASDAAKRVLDGDKNATPNTSPGQSKF